MSISTVFDPQSRPFLSVVRPPVTSAALLRKLEVLRGLEIFAGASTSELHTLAEASLLRRFERGRTLLRPGAMGECVILLEGRAKTATPRGQSRGEFALAILEPGDLVSEGWGPQRMPESAETVALESSVALFVPRRVLDAFLQRNPRIAVQFLTALVIKLRRMADSATQNTCLDVGDRLYRKLVELAGTRGHRSERGIRIDHGLFQNELAAGIGASREAVNRQLAAWRDQGLVESGRRFVLVTNPHGLAMAVSADVRGIAFEAVTERNPGN